MPARGGRGFPRRDGLSLLPFLGGEAGQQPPGLSGLPKGVRKRKVMQDQDVGASNGSWPGRSKTRSTPPSPRSPCSADDTDPATRTSAPRSNATATPRTSSAHLPSARDGRPTRESSPLPP